MKKLFVLFLLVALVPFTVGCSLWGSDDDDAVYTPPTLSASVVVPAGGISNLRANSYETFKNYTLKMGNVTLTVDELETDFTTLPNITLKFKGLGTAADIAAVLNPTVPFTIFLNNGAGKETSRTMNPSGREGAVIIIVDADGKLTDITIGGFSVLEYVAEGTFAISSVMWGEDGLGTTDNVDDLIHVNDLTPTFIVKFNINQALIDRDTLKVTANSVGGAAAQELTSDLFTVADVVGDAQAISITVNQSAVKFLTVGKTYKVSIKNAKTNVNVDPSKVIVPATYYFKAVAVAP